MEDLRNDENKCNVGDRKRELFLVKDFKYNKATNKCCKYNAGT